MFWRCRCQARPAPYPGAWVELNGHQQTPRGFAPGYLGLAFVITVITPSSVLLYTLLVTNSSSSITRPLACATLLPYLLVFIPQIMLETKVLNQSFMTPMLPVLYMYYRLWQFIRSLGLVAQHESNPVGGSAASLLKVYLVSLLVFWVFDTACTILWMPWMYDWQLQDPQLLQQLVEQRQHEQLQRGKGHELVAAAFGSTAASSEGPTDSPASPSIAGRRIRTRSMARSSPAAAVTAPAKRAAAGVADAVSPRSRRRVVSSGTNVDSFGFGA